jgi:hypothetical protein
MMAAVLDAINPLRNQRYNGAMNGTADAR